MLYELATGSPPFSGRNTDKVYDDIKYEEIPMKDYFSKEFQQLLLGLTNKNPVKRLGSTKRGGVDSIKNHIFFKGIDWAQVSAKVPKPPYLPCGDQQPGTENPFKLVCCNFEKKVVQSKIDIYESQKMAQPFNLD